MQAQERKNPDMYRKLAELVISLLYLLRLALTTGLPGIYPHSLSEISVKMWNLTLLVLTEKNQRSERTWSKLLWFLKQTMGLSVWVTFEKRAQALQLISTDYLNARREDRYYPRPFHPRGRVARAVESQSCVNSFA